MADTPVGALLTLIGEILGPTNWNLYKQYTLDILQKGSSAALSACHLEKLVEIRPSVVLLHNDLALEVHTGSSTDLPYVGDGPGKLPPGLVEKYRELCRTYFVEEVRRFEMMNMGDDTKNIDPAEHARQDAIAFLNQPVHPSAKAQTGIDAVVDGLNGLGL